MVRNTALLAANVAVEKVVAADRDDPIFLDRYAFELALHQAAATVGAAVASVVDRPFATSEPMPAGIPVTTGRVLPPHMPGMGVPPRAETVAGATRGVPHSLSMVVDGLLALRFRSHSWLC